MLPLYVRRPLAADSRGRPIPYLPPHRKALHSGQTQWGEDICKYRDAYRCLLVTLMLRKSLIPMIARLLHTTRLSLCLVTTCAALIVGAVEVKAKWPYLNLRLSEASSQAETEPDLSQAEDIILSQTNHFREEQGRQAVYKNTPLTEAAEYFAEYMARTEKFGHTADGQQPAERARQKGYDYCLVTENIGYQSNQAGFTTEQLAQGFVQGWQDSPEHRENMLAPHVVDIGVGIARSEENGAYFAVQMFGRPKDKAIELTVSNQSNSKIKYTLLGLDKTFSLTPRATQIHRQCQPTQVQFATQARDETYSVEQDTRFVVTQDQAGNLQIEK
jgi:uncharacterized protein YkwD